MAGEQNEPRALLLLVLKRDSPDSAWVSNGVLLLGVNWPFVRSTRKARAQNYNLVQVHFGGGVENIDKYDYNGVLLGVLMGVNASTASI